MSDYKEKVNSLREHADLIETSGIELYGPSATRLLVYDLRNAAAAIEALQAEQKKTVTQIFGEEQMAWEGRCKDLLYQIENLQAQLPKRGEWIYDGKFVELNTFYCSKCKRTEFRMSDFCPNCGADMRDTEANNG